MPRVGPGDSGPASTPLFAKRSNRPVPHPKPETRNPEPETRNPSPKSRIPTATHREADSASPRKNTTNEKTEEGGGGVQPSHEGGLEGRVDILEVVHLHVGLHDLLSHPHVR